MQDCKNKSEVSITFVEQSGEKKTVQASLGISLMALATANNIAGIDGDCGGAAACGTCRLSIQSSQELPEPSDIETDLLEFVAEGDLERQRLGCQISVTADLDGGVFRVAT